VKNIQTGSQSANTCPSGEFQPGLLSGKG